YFSATGMMALTSSFASSVSPRKRSWFARFICTFATPCSSPSWAYRSFAARSDFLHTSLSWDAAAFDQQRPRSTPARARQSSLVESEPGALEVLLLVARRSEERRVGKEAR